jgi:CsoR family transcriptional regulator, copper-sensing transcriptional repressor
VRDSDEDVGGRVVGERILLTRNEEAKRPLVQRLNRIEGQVRGLRGMIEDDRYCLDEVQQINAITAALREVALTIIGEHVAAGVRIATGPEASETAIEDVMRVLRAAMRRE